ncbi:hypothetical protein FB561_2710 [Kribbella amoyensis]|uniref:Metalloprotease n=1 Tax=Kribbella amoyensis TaxID=996641 RepID=A0A561BRS4_9ACTN|nr:neutral zinc metallopeptidase [Kribbella amoyensis]TWD81594.1 hypothetical protein FB561_2710 [Kribbella amoyensis]
MGPQFDRPPPKKKGKGWVIVPLAGVLVVIIGLWVVGVINKQNRIDDYAKPQPSWTAPVDEPTQEPTQEPTGQPTDEPTTSTSIATTRPTAPVPTSKYTPPPRRPTAFEVVSLNSFYTSGVHAGVGCKESGARARDVRSAGLYYLQIKSCLDRAWARQLKAAGKPVRAPKLLVMNGPTQTPCSGSAPSSFYCPANETIYMDGRGDVQLYAKYRNFTRGQVYLRMSMTDTVAHEYGHHLQELTGILQATYKLRYEKSGDARLEVSRRLELQASCFGSAFLSANKNSYPLRGASKTELDYLHSHQGDQPGRIRDHGRPSNYKYWTARSWPNRDVRYCITYRAPSHQVS